MQHSGQNGDPIENSRHATTRRRARRAESGAAVVLAALLGAVAVGAVGCDGDDTTDFPQQGGSSGSGAGRSGAAGTTAGSSGSSGSSGASGAGAGGSSAGTGGAGGSSAGTGGTSAGTGGSDEPDGGTDSGVPDAGPELTEREQWAQQICATGAELDGCEQPDTCAASFLFIYDFIDATCFDEADAYFECVAAQPVTSFECAGDPASPNFIAGTPPCDGEQTDFDAALGDPNTCAD